MQLFIETHTGQRILVDIEFTDKVLTLKDTIRSQLKLESNLPIRLVFNGRDLEDDHPLTDYTIKRESVIRMAITQCGGYSLLKDDVEKLAKPETLAVLKKDKRVVEETGIDGISFFSFKPITDKNQIPFYQEVTKQSYHHQLTEEDKKWITEYTGDRYKKLKVQSYVLDPDEDHKAFLKGLYMACWASFQTDLPFTVYHICRLTELSFSWYEEGMIFYTPAFVSTSRRDDLEWKGNCKWEITLTKGNRHHAVDVKEWSQYPTEDEILISCCTRFKVISKCQNHQNKKYYVYLEYLDVE